MKKMAFAFASAAFVFLAGCSLRGIQGDGRLTTETRSVSEFTSIDASGAFDIQWTVGEPALSIVTDENILPHIKAVVAENKLRIFSEGSLSPTKGIKVVLSSNALKDVSLTGAIHLTANQVSGAALTVTSAGATSIDLGGSVHELTAVLTGACQLRASTLSAGAATVTLTGASNADVTVTGPLKATIQGAGALTYSGNPSSVEQNVSGVGTIRRRQ